MREVDHPRLQELFDEFAETFGDPQGLPPRRSHDHYIPLIK